MRILVKLGGTLLDTPDLRSVLAGQIAALVSGGVKAVVVHGGGKQMTRFLEERGVESRFVGGLRVTTPEVVDALLKVFAGAVNKELVSALVAAGAPAVGISGIDASLAVAEQLDPQLGAVGRIVAANPIVLDALVEKGLLPVIACVAGDKSGAIYNVNADQMAVACGAAWQVSKLIFLTDVDGVRDGSGATALVLTSASARRLIEEGIATGGMQAKLESSLEALEHGIQEVVIAPGAFPAILERVVRGEAVGTRIVKETS